MKKGFVSVVIPTYNCDTVIEPCLKSVKKQTYKHIEIIVVDSFSTDKTANIAKKYGRVYSFGKDPRRKNITSATFQRNHGVSKAKGEFIYWIDSDMRLTPNVINNCIYEIGRQSADAIIVPEVSVGDSFWAKCRALEKKCYNRSNRSYTDAARFIKRGVWNELGGLDSSLGSTDDFDFQARLDKNGYKTIKLKDFIYHFEGNLTLKKQFIKKFIYGKIALGYFNKYRNNKLFLAKQYLRPEFLQHLDILIKDPVHAVGMLVLKFVENSAGILGILYSTIFTEKIQLKKS